MKINEQRDTMRQALIDIRNELTTLTGAIDRKTRSPYPDGTTSNLVNSSTDVLPQVNDCIIRCAIALDISAR